MHNVGFKYEHLVFSKTSFLHLTLLHSEGSKLHRVLAFLSAIGLKENVLMEYQTHLQNLIHHYLSFLDTSNMSQLKYYGFILSIYFHLQEKLNQIDEKSADIFKLQNDISKYMYL